MANLADNPPDSVWIVGIIKINERLNSSSVDLSEWRQGRMVHQREETWMTYTITIMMYFGYFICFKWLCLKILVFREHSTYGIIPAVEAGSWYHIHILEVLVNQNKDKTRGSWNGKLWVLVHNDLNPRAQIWAKYTYIYTNTFRMTLCNSA